MMGWDAEQTANQPIEFILEVAAYKSLEAEELRKEASAAAPPRPGHTYKSTTRYRPKQVGE